MAEIHIIPARKDNYIFLIEHDGHAVVIDPADAAPVMDFLNARSLTLDAIWNTHHHGDHVGGNAAIVEATSCAVYGHGKDASRIPCITHEWLDGEGFEWLGHAVQVMDVAGHTIGHIAYYSADLRAAFVGDALFVAGCGRMFEGDADMMMASLNKLAGLPEETRVYCAHEYTLNNLAFARSVEPENEAALWQELRARKLRKDDKPTIPTTIGLEKAMNPFLRADSDAIRGVLDMKGAKDVEVFAELRARKDVF